MLQNTPREDEKVCSLLLNKLYPIFTLFVRFFPAHLSLLDGYYGYKFSMDEYNGVCFSCLVILL